MRTKEDVTISALEIAGLFWMCFAFWINQSRSPLVKGNNGMFRIIIRNMFSYTGLAKVDMTKVAVALYYSDLTKVTPGHVLGIVMGIHFVL